MGNSPSLSGLGGGKPHVRRDHGSMDSERGWRPEQTPASDTDVEEVDGEEDRENTPEIYVGHTIMHF